MKEQMINYLQSQVDDYQKVKRNLGEEDRFKKLDALIACKNMVEALIGEPVKLGFGDKVRVGF